VVTIDSTLAYLRESLSNYIENEICQQIIQKLESNNDSSEEKFIAQLDDEEMDYLDAVLENELDYARNVQNDVRVRELTEVYELLF